MRKVLSIVLGVFFYTMIPTYLAFGADAVALVTAVKGKVEVQRVRQKGKQAVRLGDQLFEEDVLHTNKNAKASLLLFDGSVINVYPNSRLALSPEDMAKKKKGSQVASISKGVLNSVKGIFSASRKRETLTAVPGIRKKVEAEEKGVRVLYPRNSMILSSRPTFRWQIGGRDQQKSFKISLTLKGITGKLWAIQTGGTEIPFPNKNKELDRGQTYFLRVESQTDSSLYDEIYFMVLDEEKVREIKRFVSEMKKIQQSDPADITPLFILAVYYKEKGLYHEALATLSVLKKKGSGEKYILEAEREIYAKVGFWKQWEAANEKLKTMK